MTDEFDEFFNRIKKYFKLDSDMFDVDFLFLPENRKDLGRVPYDEQVKGFKVSYHFERGMDKPEIRIEGNLDDMKIKEMLKNVDLAKVPHLSDLYKSSSSNEIDASKFALEYTSQTEEGREHFPFEPYSEICDSEGMTEVLLEIPGMNIENVEITFRNNGKNLIFIAQNEVRTYKKTIPLPFKSSESDYNIEVNNGIAIIKVYEVNK
jgi:HSP20 family molecular chaperone IbpA